MLTRRRRFLLAILTSIAVLLLLGLDARLKSATVSGYIPENAFLAVASDDFAPFYAALGSCDFAKPVANEIRAPLAEIQREIRLATGIRPTPLRCRVWLGKKVLAAFSNEGTGFCVRPGLALRLADLCRRTFGQTQEDDGICRFGSLYYAWKQGFLIVASSNAYVRAALFAPEYSIEPSHADDEIRVVSPGTDGVLRVFARDGLPAEGWFRGTVTKRTNSLTLSDKWPGSPMASVCASRLVDLWAFGKAAGSALQNLSTRFFGDETRKYMECIALRLTDYVASQIKTDLVPENWEDSVLECAAALWNVDTEEMTPVPELALTLHRGVPVFGAHPFEKVFQSENGIPHEWQGRPGTVIPWLGEKLTLCLAGRDNDWLLATQEPLMAELMAARVPGGDSNADLVLALDWNKIGLCAQRILEKAADSELIPRMNRKDVDSEWTQFLRAIAHLGSLRLDGSVTEDRLSFSGFLAQQKARGGSS